MIKNPEIITEEDKIHNFIGCSKDAIQESIVNKKVKVIAMYKKVTQTILLIAIIQVSYGSFVKVSSGIMARVANVVEDHDDLFTQ